MMTLFSCQKDCQLPAAIVRCTFKEMGIATLANLVAGHLYSGKSDTKLGKEL